MAIRVLHFRLSLLWTETFLDLLAPGEASNQPPLSFLGQAPSYVAKFDLAQSRMKLAWRRARRSKRREPPSPDDLSVPWEDPWGQLFWTHYLGGNPGYLSGVDAWNSLVPFRGKAPASIGGPWVEGSIIQEAFFYPHGTAFHLEANVRPRNPVTINEAVRQAFDIRRGKRFQLRIRSGGRELLASDGVARRVLDVLRARVLGAQAPPGRRSQAFSVMTIINATGVPAGTPTTKPIRRALQGVTRWDPGWEEAIVEDLSPEKNTLLMRGGAAGDVHYRSRRSRAVWFPGLFGPGGARKSLSCYHKNLTLAALQAESLGGAVNAGAALIKARQDIPVRLHECLVNAAHILQSLLEGDRTATYRSDSARRHIEDGDFREKLKQVQDFLQ